MPTFYTIAVAAVRLVLLCLLLYIFHHKIYGRDKSIPKLDNFIMFTSLAVSGFLCLGFILNQLSLLDLLVLLLIITCYLIGGLMDFSSKRNFVLNLKKRKREIGYWVIQNFEAQEEKKKKKRYRVGRGLKKYFSTGMLIAGVLYFFTFFFRYFFSGIDHFIFSDTWSTDLRRLNNLPHFYFFNTPEFLGGENLLLKLYALFTGLSNFLALYSFGTMQAGILTVVLFWFLWHITYHKTVLALMGSLAFAGFYALLPINMFSLLEHASLYSAMLFLLPSIVLSVKPQMLSGGTKKYFTGLFLLFFATFFTSLYVGVFVLVPIITLLIILAPASVRKKTVFYALGAVIISLSLLYSTYAWYQEIGFLSFLNTRLFSFEAYSYYPQLFVPYERLNTIYFFIALSGLIPAIFLFLKNRKQYLMTFVTLLYGVLILVLYPLYPDYIDSDLLGKLLSAFIPLIIITSLFFIVEAVKKVVLFKTIGIRVIQVLGLMLLLFGGYVHVDKGKYHMKVTDREEYTTLKAYHQLHENLLPYSYTVVNTESNSVMSEGSHFFMFYEDFEASYLERDSIYAIQKGNEEFLRANPGAVLTPYTYVFVYKDKASPKEESVKKDVPQKKILDVLSQLERRGRKVTVAFDSPYFNLYQIKNNSKNDHTYELISQ